MAGRSFDLSDAAEREHLADVLFKEALAIAEEAPLADLARAKLRIDTRKWMAAKLAPGRYGEKAAVNVGSEEPLVIQVVSGVPRAED